MRLKVLECGEIVLHTYLRGFKRQDSAHIALVWRYELNPTLIIAPHESTNTYVIFFCKQKKSVSFAPKKRTNMLHVVCV